MIKINSNKSNTKVVAKPTFIKNNPKEIINLDGQCLRTLIALKKAGKKGITSFQAGKLKLLRLSSYIHILRHQHNIDIITIREGKSRTARYVLIDPVEILQGSVFKYGGGND